MALPLPCLPRSCLASFPWLQMCPTCGGGAVTGHVDSIMDMAGTYGLALHQEQPGVRVLP